MVDFWLHFKRDIIVDYFSFDVLTFVYLNLMFDIHLLLSSSYFSICIETDWQVKFVIAFAIAYHHRFIFFFDAQNYHL